MTYLHRAYGPARSASKAVLLCTLMLLSSLVPILTAPVASAHDGSSGTIWPMDGSVDTGWMLLNASGADGANGTPAMVDWTMEFAPGAVVDNLTLEVRVDGGNGISIQEPLIISPDTGNILFDWRTNGWLGQTNGFDAANPHTGRLSPNTDVGATLTLPAGSEITDLVIEALSPADPVISLAPIEFDVYATAIHPGDGRLYMGIGETVVMFSANSNPSIIDLVNFEGGGAILDIEIDQPNDRLIVSTYYDGIHAITLSDSSSLPTLPDSPASDTDIFWNTHVAANGNIYAVSESGLFILDSAGTGWTLEQASDTANWPTGVPWKVLEHNGVIYVGIYDGGVARFDTSTASTLSSWTTANNLHSDFVSGLLMVGNQLMISSYDAGIARRDLSGNFWLATWNDGNWLSSNVVYGMTYVSDQVDILAGNTLHSYDTIVGTFSASTSLASLGQINEGRDIFEWPAGGSMAPATDRILVSDGFAVFAELEPGATPFHVDDLVIGSGPSSGDMSDALQLNGVVYVGSDDVLDRYSIQQARWLQPIQLGASITRLATDGFDIFVGTDGDGVHVVDSFGNLLDHFDTADGLQSNRILSLDADNSTIMVAHYTHGIAAIDRATGTITSHLQTDGGLASNNIQDIAIQNGVAYIATSDSGLARYEITNDSFLGTWRSTGVDGVSDAPLTISGDVLYLGLPGYGVVRKNLVTGDFLDPLVQGTNGRGLPSNQVFALHTLGNGNVVIGTTNGATVLTSNGLQSLNTGSGWPRPSQFFDFVDDGTDLWAATNAGVCDFDIQTRQIGDCIDAQDGLGNTYTLTVDLDGTDLYAGTWASGVAIIDTTTKTVTENWEAGGTTQRALVEIIGDTAYLGLYGIGVARYDLINDEWLTTWTDGQNGLLQSDSITSMHLGRFSDQLWIGGDFGFQVLNVSAGSEVIHISKSSSMYTGNNDPYDMVIHGNTVYYHGLYYQGDEVHRIDLDNLSSLSSLDAGSQFSISAWMYGMSVVNDVLHIAVEPTWNQNGEGGIATYDLITKSWGPNIDPTGQIDRVEYYTDSNGDHWIAWGEAKLEQYDSSGVLLGSWDSSDGFDFPIREILEYDGEILFATEDGVARYDPSNGSWLSTWTPGNGLDSSMNDEVYELWTDGTDLWVGTASRQGWQVNPDIGVLDSSGSWTVHSNSATVPSGYPMSIVECGGLIHIAMYNNWNGGVARWDPATSSWDSSFTQGGNSGLDDDTPSALTCDSSDVLYIGYYTADQPVSRFNYATGLWLSDLDDSSNGISTDAVWYDALAWGGNQLMIGHGVSTGNGGGGGGSGGYSTLYASGTTTGQASIRSLGASVTSWEYTGTAWYLGQAGGTTGYSHVDLISQAGQNSLFALPGLVNGEIQMFTGNSTHIWAATGDGNTPGGLLEGTFNANGTISWTRGWSAYGGQVVDLHLDGQTLYASVQGVGLVILDLNTGLATRGPTGFHNTPHEMVPYGNELVIGLEGTWATTAGIQVYDPATNSWTGGRLLGGLPSNSINGVEFTTSHIYVATDGGVGVYNRTASEWENSWTTMDGLSFNIISDVKELNGDIYLATPVGLDVVSSTGVTTHDSTNGLMGNSVDRLLVTQVTSTNSSGSVITTTGIYMSHDGAGSERPGVTSSAISTTGALSWEKHPIDQIPSNNVVALASDWWGVHIATDASILTHWHAASGEFQSGLSSWQFQSWPITNMRSDGNLLIAIGDNGGTLIRAANANHSRVGIFAATGATGGCVTTGGYVWISTDSGLKGWHTNGGQEVDSITMRRANPLSIGFNMQFTDVTNMTHPGMSIQLADAANSVTLTEEGTPGPHGILIQTIPLTISSPVDGAATWLNLVDMKWNVTLNMTDDQAMMATMQSIMDNGRLINGSRFSTMRLQSPSNGSMWVKMQYDWSRTETPIQGVSLWDRPDDGGSALLVNWTLVHDADFARYLIYLNEGPWTGQPTVAELQPNSPDAAVSIHSRLQTEVTTIGGGDLVDGTEYWAVVVVEYNDGRFGTPSMPFGPATPTDEVPMSPLWATGTSGDEVVALDGDVFVEWARCTALDLASTRIYASTSDISDVLGLPVHTEIIPSLGNVSTISLEAGKPHWLGFTCVDESGQEDIMNATIIGPVVPTGGVNDGVPPPKLTGVWAEDVPQDDGGRVQMGWDLSVATDCAFITIYMRELVDGQDNFQTNVDDFDVAKVVPDCDTNMTVIDSIGELPLIDGQTYQIGAVASDKWLNSDTGDVTILEVTPYVNNINGGTIPERIGTLDAWDHPGDDGTAIEIAWAPSEVDDFDYYVVWVSEHPIDDLTLFWPEVGFEPGRCGCIKMNKQWIDEEKNPIELTVNTALYGGDGLMDSLPAQIMPNVELHVAVTVHDIKGNVYLDGLTTVQVIPIDNLADDEAPNRLTDLVLYDYPLDDGTALLLEFGLSGASDIDYYEVYAASWNFDSVGQGGNGPAAPIMTLDRSHNQPILIDILAEDTPVLPGMPVTVAVVAVDSSGNAHRDMLITAIATPTDEGVRDSGAHLPDISGINLRWMEDSILVSWDHSIDASVRSYIVYIGAEEFTDTDAATMVGEVSAASSLLITPRMYPALTNETSWWIGVAAKDDIVSRTLIDSQELKPPVKDGDGTPGDDTPGTPPGDTFGDILTSENMIAAGMALIALILLLAVLRGRGGRGSRDKDWEIQEATWGIQARDGWDDTGTFGGRSKVPAAPPPAIQPAQQSEIYAAAQRIQQPAQTTYQPQPTIEQPQRWVQPTQQPPQGGVDTSFLDDLL